MINLRCIMCEHYWGAWVCEAFPDGIPKEIMHAENDHSKPINGDHGIQFKERSELAQKPEKDR